MKTLIFESIRWVNLPYTIILGGMAAYWITVILGFLDIEVFDFDVDIDVDADFGWANMLGILNVGALPFSIWFSIFAFQLWFYSLIANLTLDGILSALPGILRFIVCALVLMPLTAVTTKFITAPLKQTFEGKTITKSEFVGKECLITSSKVDEGFGTAELALGGAPQLIDVRAKPEEGLKKGDTALIFKYDPDRDLFYVTSI